jgi:hypothetical protein
MRYLKFIIVITFLGQLSLFSQNQTHPIIDTVEISYMSASNDLVLPETIIHLKTGDAIAKVYWKIIDPTNNAVVYDVNYSVNVMPVISSNGTVLCLKNNTIIQVLGTTPLPLKTYTYQIKTEDIQGNISVIYSVIKELEP